MLPPQPWPTDTLTEGLFHALRSGQYTSSGMVELMGSRTLLSGPRWESKSGSIWPPSRTAHKCKWGTRGRGWRTSKFWQRIQPWLSGDDPPAAHECAEPIEHLPGTALGSHTGCGVSLTMICARTFWVCKGSPTSLPSSGSLVLSSHLWSCLHPGPPPEPCSVPLWWRCPRCRGPPPSWSSVASECTSWWGPWSDAKESHTGRAHLWSSDSTAR